MKFYELHVSVENVNYKEIEQDRATFTDCSKIVREILLYLHFSCSSKCNERERERERELDRGREVIAYRVCCRGYMLQYRFCSTMSHFCFQNDEFIPVMNQIFLILYLICRTVDCFDTCITGSPIDPSIPLQCCADSVVIPQIISVVIQPEYLIAQLYSPNEPQADYRLNTFCK